MTTEQRTFIELRDVVAIEFECSHCHARTSVAVEHFEQPPIRCHACDRTGQWLVPGSTECARIASLGRIIRELSEPEANGGQRFRLKLQIREA